MSIWLNNGVSSARGRPTRATIYSRLDTQTEELRTRLGGLPTPHESECVWSDIWHLEAHHSTALEGNLEATQRSDGQWLSTSRAVEQYMESRPRSG